MPVIKVWCLPKQTEAQLRELHKYIVTAVVSVEDLGLKDEGDMTCLFPPDMMRYGLGEEIIVEVSGLLEKPERTKETRRMLAAMLGLGIKEMFPNAHIECFIYPFDPAQGFWSSRQ